MLKLLEIRKRIILFYSKFAFVFDVICKFTLAIVAFHAISISMGYDARFAKLFIEAALAAFCAFTPAFVLVLLCGLLTVVHVFAESLILAVMLLILYVILYCFFYRYAPEYGYAVIAIPLLYALNVPFLVPFVLGVFATPLAILPVACGVVVYYTFALIKSQDATMISGISLEDSLSVFTGVIDNLLGNKRMFLAVGVFALTVLAIWIVRKLKLRFAFEISIAAGLLVCVIGFLIGYLKFEIKDSIGTMIVGSFVSALITFCMLYARRILDYASVENVQFEDDEYYYYVKAVPKVDVDVPTLLRKRYGNKPKSSKEKRYSESDDDEEMKIY